MEFENFDSAMARFRAVVKRAKECESVELACAQGRILATDIYAEHDHPKHPTASMDGYALRSNELCVGAKFHLAGTTPAGAMPSVRVSANECVKTFTGALMADGTDTLVPVENVSIDGAQITVNTPVTAGFAVRKVGESYRTGEILLRTGEKLGFAQIALLAELGMAKVNVFVRPKVAIIATGSEIKMPGEALKNDAQIYSSNNFALAGLARALGCDVASTQIVRDDKDALDSAVNSALCEADVVITSGGVSMGDYDFMKLLAREKFELLVDGVAIKPGRHLKIACASAKLVFALPGFPLSSIVTGFLCLREYLSARFGVADECEFSGILSNDYVKKSPFLEFAPCDVSVENGKILVATNRKKQGSSAILNNLASGSTLLVASENLTCGDVVKVLKIPQF